MGIPEGVYDLSIFNGDCQTDTLESAFTVYTSDVPITGLVAINDSPTELGSVTNFTATVETGTNITYTWEFGDDTFGSSQFTTHVYAAAGVYTATVTATNAVSDEYATTEVIILALPLQSIYLPVTYK
jgi:PKD repeat protein